ncbi:MAG: fused MFS/spermidine synthase [Acidobacteria bacterium]|nr:fused MFS/spermidine synthase [Acidobacteriota bacterium]
MSLPSGLVSHPRSGDDLQGPLAVPLPVSDLTTQSSPLPRYRFVALLYASTIFLSAFLLFQVQPIAAKSILPWFGGTAAVWSTCLAFFQLVLVLGYSYAALSSRFLERKQQVIAHVALLALSLLGLPATPSSAWKAPGGGDPVPRILGLLTTSVGLPYFLLSTTGPLLQLWYARGRERGSPYRLFALSNAGSMLALLTYPVVVEPFIGTHRQGLIWSGAYVAFVLLCGICALRQWNDHRGGQKTPDVAVLDLVNRPGWGTWALWLALPACASILLLGITSHLSQDVAPVPFLWVLPLTLYLLSFVLCFDRDWWYRRVVWLPLLVTALGGVAYAVFGDYKDPGVRVMVPLYAAGFFVCCMFCHGELARLRPHPRHLTSFYLMCAAGGAVGGVFVGLVAPRLFRMYVELPYGLVACALLAAIVVRADPRSRLFRHWWHPGWLAMAALTVVLGWYVTRGLRDDASNSRVMVRNFYGVVQTYDTDTDNEDPIRKLRHGAITHGLQLLDPARRREPVSYYGPESAVSLVLRNPIRPSPRRVGVIGLGSGTLAAFGQPGDIFHFYEINPLVTAIARSEFTFLADSPATIDIVPGDARLSLEQAPAQRFDVLVIDAFSGDSIPIHLLTREAFELYFRHLAPDGVLAVHISNRYLDLRPVVSRAAEALGKATLLVETDDPDDGIIYGTTWVLVASRREVLERAPLGEAGSALDTAPARFRLWTDDYSNLLQVVE